MQWPFGCVEHCATTGLLAIVPVLCTSLRQPPLAVLHVVTIISTSACSAWGCQSVNWRQPSQNMHGRSLQGQSWRLHAALLQADGVTAGDKKEEKEQAADPMAGPGGLLARELSGIYAGFQEAAGTQAGVAAGEPWQVAFRAAAAAGAHDLHVTEHCFQM